ncbi:membrane lipoprotein lipid attachment site-containing protein [Heyndrickxia oleronia]|uniref:membrane lipoprotein lipid attachment site-containing protein n=1 Tax=Heyndrickxia oleronia TaxID=38875 RepID=UPI0020418A2F|nr:membrane lipoprotein lipid attachment site-containing protein [Heyndrickxia oleronia]MCM3239536.1 membrane lipoprotein lipid attachment site-containing protein [Heyndrickxia oleronia]
MKQIIIAFTLLLALVGCSNKDPVEGSASQQTNTPTESRSEVLTQENKELKKQLEERPALTSEQLRETMNLSFKTIQAMINKDYNYLETITNSNVTINQKTNAFIFDDAHEQDFLQSIDYNHFEYRFHHLENNVITVGFAQNNAEIVFQFSQKEGRYLLSSFITN